MSKLVGRGIVKTYGKKTVLQDVNLMLEEHKIYGMIGRNGAGKTTLLSILTAQNPATKGEILWNGFRYGKIKKLCLISVFPES